MRIMTDNSMDKPCYHRSAWLAVIAATSLLAMSGGLTGCSVQSAYVAGAAATLPQAATLKAGDAIHLHLMLEVVVDGNAFVTEHKWHCSHKRDYSMGDGKWHLHYVPSQYKFVRFIDERKAIFVGLPECPGGTAGLITARPEFPVFLVRSPDDPIEAIQVKNDVTLHGTKWPRIKFAEVVRADSGVEDTPRSVNEARLIEKLEGFHYESYYGRRYSQDAWMLAPLLSSRLRQLGSVTVAPLDKRYATNQFDGFREFLAMRPRNDYISLKFDDGAYVIDEIDPYHHVRVYRRSAARSAGLNPKSLHSFRYKDVKTGALGREQQVFDPATGWLLNIDKVGLLF